MKNFINTIKDLKRKRRSIIACPNCRKPGLNILGRYDGWIFPTRYLCKNCGYTGYSSLLIEEKKSSQKQEDTKSGI